MDFEMRVETLQRALSATVPIASTDETRPHLSRVSFTVDGNDLTLAATDGHALAKVTTLIGGGHTRTEFGVTRKQLVHALELMKRGMFGANGVVKVVVLPKFISFRATGGGPELSLERCTEESPPFDRVIQEHPKPGDTIAPQFGISVRLIAYVSEAAKHVDEWAVWDCPRTPLDPLRIECASIELKGTFVVMPHRAVATDKPLAVVQKPRRAIRQAAKSAMSEPKRAKARR